MRVEIIQTAEKLFFSNGYRATHKEQVHEMSARSQKIEDFLRAFAIWYIAQPWVWFPVPFLRPCAGF